MAKEDPIPDLYPAYIALVDSLANEESKGDVPYIRLSPSEFRILTTRRQLDEFRKLGTDAHTDTELINKLLLLDAAPEHDSSYQLPNWANLPLMDILRHIAYLNRHIKAHINKRATLLQSARQQAHNPTNVTVDVHATLTTVQEITKSLDIDRRLLQQLEKQKTKLLRRIRKQPASTILLSDDLLATIATPNPYALLDDTPPSSPLRPSPTNSPNPSGGPIPDTHTHIADGWCYPRHRQLQKESQSKPRPPKLSPTLVALQHAKDMRSLTEVLPSPIHPNLTDSTFEVIGGYKNALAAQVKSQLTVCYINLNGLTDTKLDLLHHLIRQHNIDVLICIDCQLSEKEGNRLKKRTKAFLPQPHQFSRRNPPKRTELDRKDPRALADFDEAMMVIMPSAVRRGR